MQVTLTNLSGTDTFYLSQLYRQLAPGEAVTTRRTMSQIDADPSLKALIVAGSIGIAYTEEAGDDIAGGGGLEPGIVETRQIMVPVIAAVGGTADDVTVYAANAPYAFDIVDTTFLCSVNSGGSSCTLRSAAAGGGSALSDALSTATTGTKRNATTTAPAAVAKGGSVYFRRSDNTVAGTLLITIARKS